MTRERRQYTPLQRAEATGLAAVVGVTNAARQLGIPHRTVSGWLATPTPEMQVAIARSRDDVAARLWEAVVAGTDAVLAGLRDPTARLSDKARALEVVSQRHALLVGDPTARTHNLNLSGNVLTEEALDDDEARAIVRAIRDELDIREQGPLTAAELAELATYLQAKGADEDVG